MPAHHISIEKEYNKPLSEIFSAITDHENFGKLIGAKINRVKQGSDNHINGLDSIRRINIGPLPSFEETVTGFIKDEYFEYKISKGSPIKNHIGKLVFSTSGEQTKLIYTIDFDMKLPLPLIGSIVKNTLEKQISKGLNKLK